MLWDLFSEKVGQLYRSWNTSVKLAWGLPRSTHTFLVENLLARDFFTVKQQLLGRYVNFFHRLLSSHSIEIRMVANMVGRCARSTTGRNLMQIVRETGLDPWVEPGWKVRAAVQKSDLPVNEGWRVQFLMKLINARGEMEAKCEDTQEVTNLIESLCSS